MKPVIILGGGAAGLAAAISAARQGSGRVIVAERLDRVGKKLLATGNGRCNLTNLRAGPEGYATSHPKALARILAGTGPQEVLDFFSSLGLLCQEETEGRVYPYCRQAAMVVDVFLTALTRLGIEVRCNWETLRLEPKAGGFQLIAQDGRRMEGSRVVLAAGGRAAPKLGSNGSGFSLARQLGHSCAPLYPALTPLCCGGAGVRGLKGLRAHGALTLQMGGRILGREEGEVQFTEYGLSGIPVMNLSGKALQRQGEACVVFVDLFPQVTRQGLLALLKERRRAYWEESLETLLLGTVPKRLAYALMKSAGLQPLSRKIGSLTAGELAALAAECKAWAFPVEGALGWEQAQATGGGVPLEEVDPATLESRKCPGLHLAGELLDAVGECGGWNLHWAWITGLRAGAAAGRTEG